MALDAAIETFEGKNKRILYLPAITLGYIFTISGTLSHFGLAVASIGGARFFSDLMSSDIYREGEDQLRDDVFSWLGSKLSTYQMWLYAIVSILYAIALVFALWQLFQYFDHSDPVLVGLAGIYWGVLIVVTLNIDL